MAASGTTSANCNFSGTLNNTGTPPTCVSSAGALDMAGNVMEFSADYDLKVASGATSTDASLVWALGNSYKDNIAGLPADTTALSILATNGPLGISTQIGFRCVQ